MEFDKAMEIGFFNLFLQYFQNISVLRKRPKNVSSVNSVCVQVILKKEGVGVHFISH